MRQLVLLWIVQYAKFGGTRLDINDEIGKLDHENSKTNTLKYSSFD